MKSKIRLGLGLVFVSLLLVQNVKSQNFVHPGLPFTINDLERMKANRNSVSPWKESWNLIMNSSQASLDYVMQGPAADVQNKGNDNLYISDVTAMLYHALQWYFTGEEAHAELAISLIEPWATTHKSWSGTSAHLGAAWRGGTMAQACEILRYTYPGWTDELTVLTETYFQDVFWPLFRLPNPLRAANQGANNLMGAMYVAIYCNDQAKFDMCVDAFLNDACGGISNTLPNGQCGDTGRDQGHAMGMIGNLATVCELAWAQGIDLYAALDNRLLAVHEYWCNYNLGNEVEYIGFGTCYDYYPTIGSDGRNAASSDAIPVTELVYGAYAVRKGLPAPYVSTYRQRMGIDENSFIFAKDTSFMTTAPFNYAADPLLTSSPVSTLTGVNVGLASAEGTETFADNTWIIDGAGSNVYGGSNDAFRFAYKQLSGDGSLIAKVNSFENGSASAKAAVVIRESLDANAKMGTMSLTPSAGSVYNSRGFDAADGNGSLSDGDVSVPFWIKIERRGVNIAGYVSPDGVNWAAQQNTVFSMADDYYIGLGVSSGSNSTLSTTVFSDVQLGILEEGTGYLGTFSQIEAENFDAMEGVETGITSDESGNDDVKVINSDDWMAYEISVLYSGTYTMSYRIASAADGEFTVLLGTDTLENLSFDATGGDDAWMTIQSGTPFYMSKGTDTLKIIANSDDWKINWMRLVSECKDVAIVSYVEILDSLGESSGKEISRELNIFPGFTAVLKPTVSTDGTWSWTGPNGFTSADSELVFEDVEKTSSGKYIVTFTNECGLVNTDTFTMNVVDSLYVEAEDFTTSEGVSVESTADVSGTSHVSDIGSGDWMEYVINVPFSALYNINYRIASETAGGLTSSVNGSEIEQISFDGGDWTTLTSASPVFLSEGVQTFRISSTSDNWKLNWMELKGIEIVEPCSLPFSKESFIIYRKSVFWTSGVINVSCETEVGLYALLEGIGNLNEETDYLNVYYKLDGGEKIPLVEIKGNEELQMYSLENISASTLEVIIESEAQSITGIFKMGGIKVLKARDPFVRIEAEDFDERDGTGTEDCSDVGGGLNVGSIKDGDWLKFSNINLSEVYSINARLAHRSSSEGSVEVRLGSETGTIIGRLNMPNTGNWQNWQTVSAGLDHVLGIYDVYLVFKHPSSYVGNINWLEFSRTKLDGTAINQVTTESSIVLYPNPAGDYVTIKGHANSSIAIYDMLGGKVIDEVLKSDPHIISMEGLDKGMYIVHLRENGILKTCKLIKQ